MTGHTAKGWPYALPTDALIDYPAASLELANKLDAPPFTAIAAGAFTNGWSAGPSTGVGYYIDASGFVRMQGAVMTAAGWSNATAANILLAGTLPVGVRPVGVNRMYPVHFSGTDGVYRSQGLVLVMSDGGVQFYQFSGALVNGISNLPLEGISWKAGV